MTIALIDFRDSGVPTYSDGNTWNQAVGHFGVALTGLVDTAGAATGWSLTQTSGGANNFVNTAAYSGSLYDAAAFAHGVRNGPDSQQVVAYSVGGLTPGAPYRVTVAAWTDQTLSSSWNTVTFNGESRSYSAKTSTDLNRRATAEVAADSNGEILVSMTSTATNAAVACVMAIESLASESGASITSVDSDDAVSQGQTGVVVAAAGFTQAPDTLTFAGQAVTFTWSAPNATITQPLPLDLPAGDYWVVLSSPADGSVSRLASYTVTHPIALPDPGDYDSNSALSGLGTSFPAGTYAQLPTEFSNGTDTVSAGFYDGESWADADLTLDVRDLVYLPDGSEGFYTATAQSLFPDGATDEWEITFDTAEVVPAEPPVFLGHIPNRKLIIGKSYSIDYSYYFEGASSFAADGLPVGLTLNSGTGAVSGTPTVEAVATVTITASNDDGATESNAFTLAVITAPSGNLLTVRAAVRDAIR